MKITSGERFRRMDAVLDKAQAGPKWLRQPELASLVIAALRRGEDELGQYEMEAFVVMPNHVHLLVRPETSLKRITKEIKGVTARQADQILGRMSQPFWQDESFDHWIRDVAELERARAYIENNPVTAGLAERPEQWPSSSAATKAAQARVPEPPGR